jgi:hypothetical protein
MDSLTLPFFSYQLTLAINPEITSYCPHKAIPNGSISQSIPYFSHKYPKDIPTLIKSAYPQDIVGISSGHLRGRMAFSRWTTSIKVKVFLTERCS